MMNTDRIHEIVSGIDPALVEEADGAGPENKRRMPRLARAGLIAACLCLALVGMAAAAAHLIAGNFRTISFYEHEWGAPPPNKEDGIGQVFSGYTLWGGAINFFPLSSFSEEAQELAFENGTNTIYMHFDSLDAAAAYFQVELPENTALSGLSPVRCQAQMDTSSDGLTCVTFNETFRTPDGYNGLKLNIKITVLSELMHSSDYEMWFSYSYPDSYNFTTEGFDTNGVTAMVSHAVYMHKTPSPYLYGEEYYRANLIRCGMIYEIGVECSDHPEAGRALLEEILTGF